MTGGNVQGGQIAGDQVRVEQPALFENRDYPVVNKTRSLLGVLFALSYVLNSVRLATVFSGASPKDPGLR